LIFFTFLFDVHRFGKHSRENLMNEPVLLTAVAVTLFGMCVGSFANVCIYRIPLKKSIVTPGSACPRCGSPLRFYDNIPLVSYAVLKGRCRACKTGIAFRYPLVEGLGGLLALGSYLRYGLGWEALIYFTFLIALLIIAFIDLDHRIIPNAITLPGIPICIGACLLLPSRTVVDALLGLLVGGGTLLAVAAGYRLLTGKEGLGGGDIKLLAMIGALIGWKGVLFTIFVASVVGSLAGFAVMIQTRSSLKLAIPFGPFLSLGAMAYVLLGSELTDWYLALVTA
jgi:leader peptidase (prepilin peptidase)/N-methyltransferase